MPSRAFRDWIAFRAAALDEIENAHRSVGGSGPGRRYATQQINHAFAMLLSSQFQGFCRDLHTECTASLVASISPAAVQTSLISVYSLNRALDRGNPTPGNIGADFGRFGFRFWEAVDLLDPRHALRRSALAEMNEWRNAIAHQDFDPTKLGSASLRLERVRSWRTICHVLAGAFDMAMRDRLQSITSVPPW